MARTLGREIFRVHDEYGPVVVYQDGDRRTLAFGNQVEQSCVLLTDPSRPAYVYIQAMMLSVLFLPRPRNALLLGLGGGSLARAVAALVPECAIQAVEHRAQVVRVAHELFLLPPGLNVAVGDAAAFVSGAGAVHDLIFADLYHAAGMDERQAETELLQDIRCILAPRGLMAVNLWCSEYAVVRRATETLKAVFAGQVLSLHVEGGNIVAFAFADRLPAIRRNDFYAAAQALGLRLRIPLQKLARNLWRQNAEALQVGRYRHLRGE